MFFQQARTTQRLREALKAGLDEIDDVRLLEQMADALGLPLRDSLKVRIDEINDVGMLERLLADLLGLPRDGLRQLLESPTMTPDNILLVGKVVQTVSSPLGGSRIPQSSHRGSHTPLEKPIGLKTTWEEPSNVASWPGLVQAGEALRRHFVNASESQDDRDRGFSVLLTAQVPEDLAVAWLIESVHRSWPNRKILVWLRSSALRDRIWRRLVKAGLEQRLRRHGEYDDPEKRVTFETDRERRGRGTLDVSDYAIITHPPGRPRGERGERGRPVLQIGVDVGLWGERPRSGSTSALKVAYHQRFDDAVLDGWHPGFSYVGLLDPAPCPLNPQGFPTKDGVDLVVENSLGRLRGLLEGRRSHVGSNPPCDGAWLVFCNNEKHVEEAYRCARELLPTRQVIRHRELGAPGLGRRESPVIISGRDVPLEAHGHGGIAEVFFLSPAAPSKMLSQIAGAIRTTPRDRQLRAWDLISEKVAVPPKPRGPSGPTHTAVIPGRSRVAALLALDARRDPVDSRELKAEGERSFDLIGRSKERRAELPVEEWKRVEVRWKIRQ